MGAPLLCTVLVLLALMSQGDAVRNMKMMKTMYSQFVLKYNRVHQTEEEATRRFGIFVQNLQRIDELNRRRNGATFGITKFADWTAEEFKKILMDRKVQLPLADIAKKAPVLNAAEIAENFDWRTKSGVTPVKDQDLCGGCWAFATAGVIESAYAIKNKKMLDLSEQQIIDCEMSSSGCHGGSYPAALGWAVQHGVLTESEYPFVDDDGPSCPSKNGNVFLSRVYAIQPEDADQMAAFIFNTGPIALHFLVGGDLQHYTGGIYSPSEFECYTAEGSHAVLGIGYGIENGVKYWLIKNSWGTGWGEGGYFKMIRGVDSCEIELRPYGATL